MHYIYAFATSSPNGDFDPKLTLSVDSVTALADAKIITLDALRYPLSETPKEVIDAIYGATTPEEVIAIGKAILDACEAEADEFVSLDEEQEEACAPWRDVVRPLLTEEANYTIFLLMEHNTISW